MDPLLLREKVVQEGAAEVWNLDGASYVNCWVQRELNSLDQVEDNGVFEAAEVGVSGVRKRVGWGEVGGKGGNISW